MKQKFNSILLHLPPYLVIKLGKNIKACFVKLSDLFVCSGGNWQKHQIFWLHPPPTSLEAYSLLYLHWYSSVLQAYFSYGERLLQKMVKLKLSKWRSERSFFIPFEILTNHFLQRKMVLINGVVKFASKLLPALASKMAVLYGVLYWNRTVCLLDIHLYLTPLEQARQFLKTCGT